MCIRTAPLQALSLLCLALSQFTGAQNAQETIFASVAYVRTGERLPLVDAEQNFTTLTPFGAQQMNSLGGLFRSRYMPQDSSRIQGLSVNEIDNLQTYILAHDSPYSVASAQAFIQSLYPPYRKSSDASASLSNGSADQFPLGGYQYPWIQSVSANDARSIYIDGSSSCASFIINQNASNTSDYQNAELNSEKLYAVVGGTLGNSDLPADDIVFENAFGVYDYMSYAYNHNKTIQSFFAPNGTLNGTLDQLHAYSNLYQWNIYGQPEGQSASQLNTIAGQTFSLAILSRLASAIQTSGSGGKLSLLFGEYPAMLSFSALAHLPSVNTAFYGMPDYASTMIFELFSTSSANIGDADNASDLRVRFLFANGTDTFDNPMPTSFMTYPLFDSGAQDLPWNDFANMLSAVALPDAGSWCDVCDAWDIAPFCMAYNSTAWDAANGIDAPPRDGPSRGMMSAPLAGVVGAVATLAALCVFLVFAVGCCGMRIMQRKNPPGAPVAATATTSRLGGFKGDRKLASDPDLTATSPKSPRSDKHASGLSFGNGDKSVMGHERVGSWELKQPKRAASTKSCDEEEGWGVDGLGKEVQVDDRV